MKQKLNQTLASYVDAFRPIVFISHFDYIEVKNTIRAIDQRAQCIEFDNAMGRRSFSDPEVLFGKQISSGPLDLVDFLEQVKESGYECNTFLVLKDVNEYLCGDRKDMRVVSYLKYIAERTLYASNYHTTIFILSDTLLIPHELENYITIIDYPLPEIKEIDTIIREFSKDMNISVKDDVISSIALSLKGLNEFQITQILNLAFQNGGNLCKEDEQLILKEKEQFIKKSGMLEIVKVKEKKEDIGGLV